MEWISVEDRLPEWLKDVLVWYPEKNIVDVSCIYGDGGFSYEGCFGMVTHWSELPEPPCSNKGAKDGKEDVNELG